MATKMKPVSIQRRVCWAAQGNHDAGYIIMINKEMGFKPGDKVKVTIERIEK